MGRARSRSSTSTVPKRRMRRSTFSSTVARGGPIAVPITRFWPNRSCKQGRITSFSTLRMWTTPAQACFPWSSRCAGQSPGSTAMPRALAVIPDGFISRPIPPARISGCVVTHDWRKQDLPIDILKGAALSSGMYDLKPVRLSKRSKYVKVTDEMEEALSAARHIDKLHTPLILAHGTYETPEFQRQTRDFYAAVKAAGKPVEMLVGEGYNHFEMLETLANPYGLLGRAVFAQMGLAA